MTPSRRRRLLTSIGWLVVCGACSAPNDEVATDEGGQTGSAGCGVSPRCICDSVVEADVVRGVLTSADTEANVEVLEVFGAGGVAAGDVWVGPYQVGFPCGLGSLPPVAAGSEVFVAWQRAQGANPRPNMYVVAWEPTLQLTPSFTLAASDAATLAEASQCEARFPDEEVVCTDEL